MAGHSWQPRDTAQYATVLLLALGILLSAASLLFGLLAWTCIKKWRQFHNYVFLQVIIASIVYITTYFCVRILFRYEYNEAAEIILELFFNVMLHWQLVTTVMFYLEFVKVIALDVSRSLLYLVANLFAWVLPILEAILDLRFQQMDLHLMKLVVLAIAIVNCLLYLSVLYVLIKNARVAAITKVEVLRHFLVSTFAFATSGVTLLVPVLTMLRHQGLSSISLSQEDIVITYLLNLTATVIYFLSMKNHRELWVEYRCNRSTYTDDVILIEQRQQYTRSILSRTKGEDVALP